MAHLCVCLRQCKHTSLFLLAQLAGTHFLKANCEHKAPKQKKRERKRASTWEGARRLKMGKGKVNPSVASVSIFYFQCCAASALLWIGTFLYYYVQCSTNKHKHPDQQNKVCLSVSSWKMSNEQWTAPPIDHFRLFRLLSSNRWHMSTSRIKKWSKNRSKGKGKGSATVVNATRASWEQQSLYSLYTFLLLVSLLMQHK